MGMVSVDIDNEDSQIEPMNGSESRKVNAFHVGYDLGSGKLVVLGNDDALGYQLWKNRQQGPGALPGSDLASE